MTQQTRHIFPDIAKGDWNIICDFDGTIARFDVTDAVLGRFADPAWEVVEREWLDGRISARECMERQIRMIGVKPPALDAFLATVPLTDGFVEFVQHCVAHGLDILIVSDGMDYAIKRILSNNGLGDIPVIANRLRFRDGSGFRLNFPYGAPGCTSGVCKCNVAKAGGGKILLIGDGHSDACLAGKASFVLAKEDKFLHHHCVENGVPYTTYGDFFDILRLLAPASCSAEVRETERWAVALPV